MNRSFDIKKTVKDLRIIFCLVIFVFAIILIGITLRNINNSYLDTTPIKYDEMWSYESGSIVDLDDLEVGDSVTIHKRLDEELVNTRSLCFHSKNIHFSVYYDGEMIYDFHPDTPKYMGKAYGVLAHSVSLPVITRDGDVKFVIENLYPGGTGYIKDMHLDSSNNYIISEIKASVLQLLACVITVVFGVILAIIGLFGRDFGDKRFEIVSFGAFSTASALWIATGTQADVLLTGAPVAVHFANYLSLDLMSYPGLIFGAYITGNKNSKLPLITGILTVAKIVYSFISTCLGYSDYHQLLYLTHLVIIVTVLIFMYYIIKGIVKKTFVSKLSVFVTVFFAVSMIFSIIDVILYLMNKDTYIAFSRATIMLYFLILICGIYEFVEITEMSKRGKYAEVMEKMAYQDELTGMFNRKAFNRSLKEAKNGDLNYTFVMLDLNYLKNVNDQYGHAMGDKYITNIADYITESFSDTNHCFRIGGDEFFVMSEYAPEDERFQDCINTLSEKVSGFNNENNLPIDLSVAYGYEVYHPGTDDQNEILRISDEKMYEMKARMKKNV